MYGTYSVDPINTRAVQGAGVGAGKVEKKRSVLDYGKLHKITGVNVFNVNADVGAKTIGDVLRADADGLKASGKYIKPQKPQMSSSGIFPDNTIKISSLANEVIAGNALLKTIGTGALVGGGVGLASSAVSNAGTGDDAMTGYLGSPEGKMRMSNDPEFSAYILSKHPDAWKSVVQPTNPINEIIKDTAAGAAKGALSGALAHTVRESVGGF